MPYPASLKEITLTGDFLDGAEDGNPRPAVVTITLPTPIRSEGDNVIIPPFDMVVSADAGTFSVALPATTDPDWLPNTAEYIVQAVFPDDHRKLWWSFPLPWDSAGDTVDLADLGAPNVGTPSLTIRQGTSQPLADGGYKGTWAVGSVYRSGDTVQHVSTVYGALRPSSGVTPGTNAAVWKSYPSSGGGGGAVDSVFGRSGDVVAQSGDYTKAMVGLANVDNTTDLGKPVSTAQAAADATVASNAAAALASHEADTTNVHGIADTSVLATATDLSTGLAGKQNLDSDLTTIAGLTPANDDVIQRKGGAWANRSMAQLAADVQGSLTVGQAQVTGLTASLAAKADLVGGVVPTAQIPAIAITDYLGTVANQAAMLALAGQKGDWAIRTDTGVTWVITGNDPTQLADWTALSYPGAPVTSVNGQTGVVVLAKGDVGLGNVDNTSDVNKPVSTATQTALDAKAPLASPALTGTATAVNLTQSGRYLNTPDVLTDAATIAVDASLGNDFTVTLGGNRTLGNPTNSSSGQKILFAIRQDGTGSRTLTLGSDYRLGSDITAITLSTAANATDYLGVRYNATDSKWDVLAFVKGYV